MLLTIGALIDMEIKVVYIVIHDATVDKHVSASRKCFNITEKHCNAVGWWVGNAL